MGPVLVSFKGTDTGPTALRLRRGGRGVCLSGLMPGFHTEWYRQGCLSACFGFMIAVKCIRIILLLLLLLIVIII